MSSATAPLETPAPTPWALAGIWARHLASLYIPGLSLAFVLTGPHPWWVAILFMLPMVYAHHLDCAGRVERRQPARDLPAWPFDALVYVLAALQVTIVLLTVRMFAGTQGVFSVDMVMVFLVVGGSSGFSIITAHELIHRPRKWEQRLGRVLLGTVLYEHFYTEHLRGHHVRVGTPEDPATARFGERYEDFFRRTVPAQLRSAWRLETARLGDPDMPLLDRRQLGNRVLHGLAGEAAALAAVLAFFGVASLVAFVVQAFMAVRLLEAVNYFEHWGLQRRGSRVQPVDSWDTHGWFTYYGLVGLSRHADHHAYPVRPYQKLRVWDEAPLLPYGYVGTVDQVMADNDAFMDTATLELARRRLGPFAGEGAEAAEPVPPDAARERLAEARRRERPARGPSLGPLARLRRLWQGASGAVRRAVLFGGVVLVTATGAHLEAVGPALGFPARLALHAWILAAVVLTVIVGHRLKVRWENESLAWTLAMALLVVLGGASDALLG